MSKSEEERNKDILAKGYHLWNEKEGDPDVWLELLDDHVEWRSLVDGNTNLNFTKTRISKEEVIGYFDQLTDEWSMNHFTVDEMIAKESRVVVICNTSWRNKKTGKCFQLSKVDI